MARAMMDPRDPESFNHRFQYVNGIKLHYVDEGEGPTAVVLVHGWPDLWYGWRHQIKPLVHAGFRVIVPDLRGFGQSIGSSAVESYRKKNVVEDLTQLLDMLSIPKAVFIGHDWGGVVVWRVCLHRPDKVLAVAGICTPYAPPNKHFIPLEAIVKHRPTWAYQLYFTQPEAEHEFNADPEKLFRCVLRSAAPGERIPGAMLLKDGKSALSSFGDPPRSSMLTQGELDYYVQEYKRTGFGTTLNWYKTRELDFEDEVNCPRVIPHPALMITVGKDPVLTPAMSKHMEKVVPQLSRGHVEEAGHFVQQERPVEVNKILVDWLHKIQAPSKL